MYTYMVGVKGKETRLSSREDPEKKPSTGFQHRCMWGIFFNRDFSMWGDTDVQTSRSQLSYKGKAERRTITHVSVEFASSVDIESPMECSTRSPVPQSAGVPQVPPPSQHVPYL
jgi:hypothetical protein